MTGPTTTPDDRQDVGVRPSAADVLAKARAGRVVLQDFTPLAQSLEWEIGQHYFKELGNRAFIGAEAVPFVINNDGALSVNAAEVLFAGLLAAEKEAALPEDLFVLEIGIGVGLFARFFLDAFRDLCARHGKDYYDRLCYVAADRSERMLRDAGRHGIFADHPGRYVLRAIDALCPEQLLRTDPLFQTQAPRPLRAVFLNYVLDCLPPAILKVDASESRQLCVRTCVGRSAPLKEFTDVRPEDLPRLVSSQDPADRQELVRLFDLLAADYEFRPIDLASIPRADFAAEYARSNQLRSVLHNYGALQSLERLLELLDERGLILINDYGSVRPEAAEGFEHQRFAQTTAVGINFALLKAFFAQQAGATWIEPEDEGASIHARLLGRGVPPEVAACFRERFAGSTRKRREEPVERARQSLKVGRLEAALAAYQQALAEQPYNWVLAAEVAQFLGSSGVDPVAGLELARAAVVLNPACSPDVWNTLGDCLFGLGRFDEARGAYDRALRLSPEDVRARYNLAFVHQRDGAFEAALVRIAEALVRDKAGGFREGLLRKQAELLEQLARRHQGQYLRMADRVSRPVGPAPGEGEAAKVLPGSAVPAVAGTTERTADARPGGPSAGRGNAEETATI